MEEKNKPDDTSENSQQAAGAPETPKRRWHLGDPADSSGLAGDPGPSDSTGLVGESEETDSSGLVGSGAEEEEMDSTSSGQP